MVGKAEQQGNLYCVCTKSIIPCPVVKILIICPVDKISIELLWHERLSHASNKSLSHLLFGLNFDCQLCDSCHKAKQQRLSFYKSDI